MPGSHSRLLPSSAISRMLRSLFVHSLFAARRGTMRHGDGTRGVWSAEQAGARRAGSEAGRVSFPPEDPLPLAAGGLLACGGSTS